MTCIFPFPLNNFFKTNPITVSIKPIKKISVSGSSKNSQNGGIISPFISPQIQPVRSDKIPKMRITK